MTHLDIPGFFDYENLYSEIAFSLPNNSVVVEVGVYCGRSLAYYISQMQLAKKSHSVYAVDVWINNYGRFLEYAFNSGINKYITPVRADSVIASYGFADNSVDFCFIDADHRYKYVKADILAWLPKVKESGILAGHDLDAKQCGGVRKAVEEVLGKGTFSKWGRSWVFKKGYQ